MFYGKIQLKFFWYKCNIWDGVDHNMSTNFVLNNLLFCQDISLGRRYTFQLATFKQRTRVCMYVRMCLCRSASIFTQVEMCKGDVICRSRNSTQTYIGNLKFMVLNIVSSYGVVSFDVTGNIFQSEDNTFIGINYSPRFLYI